MESILLNDSKIKEFAKLQEQIKELKPKSKDAELDQIIENIPKSYLSNKEDLMIICQLFIYYLRLNSVLFQKNTIKLLQRIMQPIQTYLQNESSFFWNITGGSFYFKLWLYEEGLISIESIIQACQEDDTFYTSEYFYPEILKEKPEIFENETKYQLKKLYSEEEKEEFIKLRKKHFNWLLNSGDFNDPLYLQIESNPLRLCIKKDDVDTFQKVLSQSNISINSKIQESLIEYRLIHPREETLIEYAINFKSKNIYKFMILKNVELNDDLFFSAINSRDYEIIHLIESKLKDRFEALSFISSIFCWNDEMIDYLIDNYDYDFLLKSGVPNIKRKIVLEMIFQTFYSSNFLFLDSIVLPFLRNNKEFVDQNIYDIISSTFCDMSGYFAIEFLKYPNIDINHIQNGINYEENDSDKFTLLGMAVFLKNFKVCEYLLSKYSNIHINEPAYLITSPFQIACRYNLDIKFLELLSKYNDFDIYVKDSDSEDAVITSILNKNFYALEFIFNKFNDYEVEVDLISLYIYNSLTQNDFMTLKIFVKFLKKFTKDELIEKFKDEFSEQPDYDENIVNLLKKVIDEIK